MSLYAATKAATEAMGHSYAHLYGIPTTFFRFFTVYGPWARPDMALLKFARAIRDGRPIDVYNEGRMVRDFTYVGDIVAGIQALVPLAPGQAAVSGDSLSPVAPFRIVNIGAGTGTGLMDYIRALEEGLGKKATINFLPMQPGDVPATHASVALLETLTGSRPRTPLQAGMQAFCDWFMEHDAPQ
jgi:UDP-glucuronate 4-epimerase